jgi:hypothetical protein
MLPLSAPGAGGQNFRGGINGSVTDQLALAFNRYLFCGDHGIKASLTSSHD